MASNSVKMSAFAAGWTDEHLLSQPLTGAVFDILVDIFQENLVERGVISREIADLADRVEHNPEFQPVIQAAFDRVFPLVRQVFHEAWRRRAIIWGCCWRRRGGYCRPTGCVMLMLGGSCWRWIGN